MILGLLQARMSSSRLPGKVLRPLCGEPMIFRQLERQGDSRRVDQWMVVTSTESSDLVLREECAKRNMPVFAGSLNDVLDRFYHAALPLKPEIVVRTTADCPVIDPELIDQLVDFHLAGKFEYSSNALEPTYPDGLDCEVVNWPVLETAWKNAKLPSEREHVTPYVYKDFKTAPRFKIGSYRGAVDLSSLRWTVDEPRDFELITKIYEALYPKNTKFRTKDILQLLEAKPDLLNVNSGIIRNEGYLKSLAKDREWKPT